MKILIGCNLLTSVNSLAYPNHMQFWTSIGRQYQKNEVLFFSPRRMSIDRMRNEAAKMALQYDCDLLFFYDDDVLLPDDTLEVLTKTLLDNNADIVAGVTCVRSYPYKPMIFKYVKTGASIYSMTTYDDYAKDIDVDGILKCGAVGFSCCLIDVKKTLKELDPPYFVTGPQNTEDVYFCHKVNTELEESKILVDTNISTGHILDNYYISPGNKQHFVRLEKGLYHKYPDMLTIKNRGDRDAEYREQVLERLRRAASQM